MKAQLLTELPYHRVRNQQKINFISVLNTDSGKKWRIRFAPDSDLNPKKSEKKIDILILAFFIAQIESPRKQNKYLEFFGSYIALPLMTIILIVSALILFLLVKTYFSNSYMYAFQNNLDNKNNNMLDISSIIDTRYEQFNNRKPIYSNANLNKPIFSSSSSSNSTNSRSLLEKALLEKL